MYKKIILAAFAAISLSSAEAVVVVNGVAGEDLDNASPFETLQAALDFANNGIETVIEIQTTSPILGASLRGKVINHPLTIQGGAGLWPKITTALDLLPTTGTELVTLKDLNVNTTGPHTPLIIGTSVSADNCNFDNTPTAGIYGPAVTAAVESNTTTATVTMTSCTMRGHFGLQAGRAAQTYNLTRCVAIGQTTDLVPNFSQGINNNMNWFSSYASRMGAAEGYQEITTPRVLNLDQCIVRGGLPLAWPTPTLPDAFYTNENFTIGPITAVNTVFESLNINGPGEASRIHGPALPHTQTASSTFRHCTYRSNNQWGAFYMWTSQPTTITFINCLFDSMFSNYGLAKDPSSVETVTFAGDANTYHVPAGVEVSPAVPFESTKHFYIGNTAEEANITDTMGALVRAHDDIVAEAIITVPPTLLDKDGNSRPMPVSALASDIGADEIDETAPATVRDWSVY